MKSELASKIENDFKDVIEYNAKIHAENKSCLENLQNRIDELQAKGNRLGNQVYTPGSDPRATAEETEHKKSFLNSFMRKGVDNGLRDLEIRAAMTDGSDPDGGYAIPVELDRNIDKILRANVAMRQISEVISAGVGYHRLKNVNNATSGWVGETDERPETGTPSLIKLTPYFGEIYANPAASQNSLDDIFFDVENFLLESISEEFVSAEGSAFLSGNGINKPKGLLTYPTATTADATRPFGTIQYVVTGDANGFPTVTAAFSPYDVLLDLIGAVKAQYRQGACFLMNKKTLTALRKIKTATQGEYIVEPATATAPNTIWGYPVVEDEGMPDIGANAFPIAFGNFKKAYTIVDLTGTRMLRDAYTKKPFVQFYSTKRVGSFLNDSNAVKFLKVSA